MDLKDRKDIEKLIKGCINKQSKYQEILHRAFYSKMLVVCMAYAKNRAEAEDLLHDGFIKLYQKLPKYNYQGSFEGWVRRIITNNAIDFIRKRKEFTIDFNDTHLNLVDETEHEKSNEDKELIKAKAEKIIAAIQQLSPAYKAVFNMYILENMSHKEIAQKLNISVGSSKSNLFKAKKKIKDLLGL